MQAHGRDCAERFQEILLSKQPGGPEYYWLPDGGELWRIIAHLPFLRGSIIKYVYRAGAKDAETELADLRKARRSLDIEIERKEREINVST